MSRLVSGPLTSPSGAIRSRHESVPHAQAESRSVQAFNQALSGASAGERLFFVGRPGRGVWRGHQRPPGASANALNRLGCQRLAPRFNPETVKGV